ncbi:YgfZ/GcvT domain-containing protein [Lacunisphaera limnophila]|uniref:CAF17-like 4Fe-4S cluster assembly/insertion protein YgfZ n=1 Tax=Lacunisphaera limnophila TaxID=1838286 RepID=UPI001471AB89|nr:folate-binding protein [Lacunisphaera limnophila]
MLRVRGPDANSYLQGQFTQDLKQAKMGPCYGLWLDQKGKVLADSHIQQIAENEYLVISLTAPAAVLQARLEAYLIADEVELHDETGEWVSVLLWGDNKPVFPLPVGAVGFPSRRAGVGAGEILVPAAQAEALLAQVRHFAVVGDRAAAELARLRAGMPSVPADLGPRDLPAEGALDEVAISYTKGCYLGQEVMARLKNLGQVRRALHVVGGVGAPPAPGTVLYQGERKAGEVRSGAADGGNFLAMAMLSLVQLDPAAPLGLAPGGEGSLTILRRV